jgi:DNA repair exonuclease SbcCD nuclease subunit
MTKRNQTIRIGLFSDLHLQNDNKHYKRSADGKSDLLSASEELIDVIASKQFDIVIFAGDLTDEENLDPYVLKATNKAILGSIAKSTPVYILLEGNHCIVDGQNKYSVLSGYKDIVPENVHLIVDQTEDIAVEVKGKTVYIRSVPYLGDYDLMRNEIIKPLEMSYADVNILVYHAATTNALMDNGLPAVSGLTFQEDDLDQYHIAFAGDFHRPQNFSVGQTDVHYIGAPFALTRGQRFNLQYRELTVDQNNNLSIVDHANTLARAIVDVDYEDLSELDNLDNNSIVYINNVPASERRNIDSLIDSYNFYSCKIKIKPVQREIIKDEARQAKLNIHKTQDVREILNSLLTEDEKSHPWTQEVISTITQ